MTASGSDIEPNSSSDIEPNGSGTEPTGNEPTGSDTGAPIDPTASEPDDSEPVDAELVPIEPAGTSAATAAPGVGEPGYPADPGYVTDPGYTASGVPTFDAVRERIEQRIGRAAGTTELDAASSGGHEVEDAWEKRQKAAQEKLEQIRASMKRDSAGEST